MPHTNPLLPVFTINPAGTRVVSFPICLSPSQIEGSAEGAKLQKHRNACLRFQSTLDCQKRLLRPTTAWVRCEFRLQLEKMRQEEGLRISKSASSNHVPGSIAPMMMLAKLDGLLTGVLQFMSASFTLYDSPLHSMLPTSVMEAEAQALSAHSTTVPKSMPHPWPTGPQVRSCSNSVGKPFVKSCNSFNIEPIGKSAKSIQAFFGVFHRKISVAE